MTIHTWTFNDTTGTIPGIPGEFHAGLLVDVDTETMQVIAVRLRNAPDTPPIDEAAPSSPVLETVPTPKTRR